jgi:hypothetical protein
MVRETHPTKDFSEPELGNEIKRNTALFFPVAFPWRRCGQQTGISGPPASPALIFPVSCCTHA